MNVKYDATDIYLSDETLQDMFKYFSEKSQIELH